MTAVWNDVVNHMNLEEYDENKHWWCDTLVLESDAKRLEITTLCIIVDDNAKSVK